MSPLPRRCPPPPPACVDTTIARRRHSVARHRGGRPGTAALLAAALALTACGGGGGESDPGTAGACDLVSQQTDLRGYMRSWYYFSATMPDPAPEGFSSIDDYFEALLAPEDSWSHVQSSTSFEQFFEQGRSLGYGLFVAGQDDDPLPLRVRYVTPGSPADGAGLRRGMIVDAIDGQDPAVLKATGDFGALSPTASGQQLALVVRDTPAATPRSLSLIATVHALTPVAAPQLFTSPGGRQVGYLYHMNFIDGAGRRLADALARFKQAGVQDLVLDLRYNSGGYITMARDLASAVAGPPQYGKVFARLNYNAQHQAQNVDYHLLATGLTTLDLTRLVVLSGPRTCSAAELVINGLRPLIDVVQVGGTSCGKPYGFNPVSSCGRTWNAVNFQTTNSAGVGDYTSGLAPRCAAADDFDHALGDPAEGLTARALALIDGAACPVAAGAGAQALSSRGTARRLRPDGDPAWAAQMR
ncbi:MAG: hypothetical protein RL375_4899 [Pseudomonadota bacterium]